MPSVNPEILLVVLLVAAGAAKILSVLTGMPRIFIPVLVAVAVMTVSSIQLRTESLGRPRHLEVSRNLNVDEAEVLWASASQDGILLLMTWKGLEGPPRYHTFPFSQQVAEQLRQAQANARAKRRALKVRRPFDGLEAAEGEETPDAGSAGVGYQDGRGAEKRFYAAPPAARQDEKYGEAP